MNCPDYEEILAAVGAADAHPSVRNHCAGCESCSARLDLARHILGALQAGPLPEVPPRLSVAAKSIGRAEGAETLLERVREYFAELVFDSWRDRPALALRGQGLARRHLLFRAGGYELDLAFMDPDSLVGQILPEEAGAGAFPGGTCVLSGVSGEREVVVTAGGEFCFEGVEPGRYGLWVESGDLCLVVGEVDLGGSEAEA